MKRILAWLLAALVLLAGSPAAQAAEPAGETLSIRSVEDFLRFADACALESYSKGKTFSLTADLDLSNTGFAAIPYFAGTFKGNGHVILGLRLEGEGSRQGLFRQLGESAVLQNLNVKGTVAPGGSRCYVGGLAGVNAGTIDSCSFEGSVSGLDNVGGIAGENAGSGTIRNCSVRGSVAAEHQSGGVAGVNRGLIDRCTGGAAVNTESITPSGESHFDLATLTLDDFLDLANIGGIAGDNGGTILNCRSSGDVGYRYTGYNVGGVAGKSSGYVSNSSSHGAVRGRRDVGGIVGQLIPYAAWDLSEGRLDDLSSQIAGMNALLSRAADDAQGMSLDLVRELAQMADLTRVAVEALEDVLYRFQLNDINAMDSFRVDIESGQISFGDFGTVDTGALTTALYNMYGQSTVLAEAAGDGAGSLADDIADIGVQMNRIFNSLFTTVSGMQNVTGETYDLSAGETYKHDVGAVAACENYGPVEAENNAGGVVGSISFEVEFDQEDQLNASDYLLSNAKQYLFAAVRNCGSYSDVTAKQDAAGGIVGDMDIGAVVKCVGLGTAVSESGDYVGGIVGQSQGTIRDCWSRMVLSGGSYVGGIAGLGDSILSCRSWTHIQKGGEYLGAIAGWAEGEIAGNLYVSGRPAAVDDVSRVGQAAPIEASDLLAMEGAPADFDSLTLRFVVEGKTVQSLELPFGGSVEQLPEVPNKGDQYWKWDDFDREHIYHSMRVEGKYYAPNTTIGSGEEPPKFLVEGVFYEGQTLRTAAYAPGLPGEEILEAATLYVEGYEGELTVRMNQSEAGTLYTAGPGGVLEKTACTRDGTYVVFRLPNGGSFAYVRSGPASRLPLYLGIGGGAAALAAIAGVLIHRKKKKARSSAEQLNG